MIKFNEFLIEEMEKENKEKILQIVKEMSDDERYEFGCWLLMTFFTDDEGDEFDDDDIEDIEDFEDDEDEEYFTYEYLKDIIEDLPSEIYEDLLHDLELETDDSEEDDEDEDDLDEGVSRIQKASKKNRRKRKFMKKSKSVLRREAPKRKMDNRKSLAKRKRYYKANKNKILSYQKSRGANIKGNTHIVKMRRMA